MSAACLPAPSADPGLPVICTVEDGVATVTLNRPEAMNALSPEIVVRLIGVWQAVRDRDDIHAAVLTGTGSRAFCTGADLKRLVPLLSGRRGIEDQWDELLLSDDSFKEAALLRGFDCGKPVICALNGRAMGGGFELAQNCDIRLAARGIALSLPEVRWGLFPAGGSTVNLPRLLPPGLAMEMLLTGRELTADEACRHGLVNALHEADALLGAAQAIAGAIAAASPVAVQAILRAARATVGLPYAQALQLETDLAMPVFASDGATAGLRDFAARKG